MVVGVKETRRWRERTRVLLVILIKPRGRNSFFIKWVGGWRWLFIGGHIIILLLLLGETPKLLLYCNRLLFSYGDFFFASVKDMTLLETPQRRDEKRYIKCLGHVVVYKERFY